MAQFLDLAGLSSFKTQYDTLVENKIKSGSIQTVEGTAPIVATTSEDKKVTISATTEEVKQDGTNLVTSGQVYTYITGQGFVKSVAKGDASITVGGTDDDPTVAVALSATDKFLSLGTDGLLATASLTYGDVVEGERTYKAIRLLGKNNEVISTIDATDFLKDGMLENAELVVDPTGQPVGTYLHFTFNTVSGKSEIYVNVTSLIDTYTAGVGLSVADHQFSVVIDSTSEGFLTVSASGIKLNGIQTAIDTAVENKSDYGFNKITDGTNTFTSKTKDATINISGTGSATVTVDGATGAIAVNVPETEVPVADVQISSDGTTYTTVVTDGVAKVDLSGYQKNLTANNGLALTDNTIGINNTVDAGSKGSATDTSTETTTGTVTLNVPVVSYTAQGLITNSIAENTVTISPISTDSISGLFTVTS